MTVVQEFEKFISRGNLVQLAIAFVMGAAFATLVTALVADLITPLIGVPGHLDFSSWKFQVNGSTFAPGGFVNAVAAFLIIALVVFFAIALPYQRYLDRQEARKKATAAATTKECPYCVSSIPIKATRCPQCTSQLPTA